MSAYDLGTVTAVDTVTGRVLTTYRVGIEPRGLAWSGGAVWVANQLSNTVSRIVP